VTTKPPKGGSPSPAQATANPGLVRPPLVYLVSLAAGVLIQLAMPLPFLPRTPTTPLGATLIVVAVALFVWSVRTFRAAGTPIPGNKPTTAIVGTGPYRISRNPIYLAFSLFEFGIAVWADSLWLLATLAGAVAVMNHVVIPREEGYLERSFGAQYLDYRASVRRWV
jgi:protein-S-isoprenylcysteine O-methyltransferase Ste14